MKTDLKIWLDIETCKELKQLEIKGFQRGKKKGKTMSVPLSKIFESLMKQWRDLHTTFFEFYHLYSYGKDSSDVKKCIADLRNVAGCLFLKILEMEDGYSPDKEAEKKIIGE